MFNVFNYKKFRNFEIILLKLYYVYKMLITFGELFKYLSIYDYI